MIALAYEKLPPYWAPSPSASREPPSRLKKPPVRVTPKPSFSRGDLVITFTTPVSAFAPHTTEAGPRTTSICLISPELAVGMKSHSTRPKKSRYTERPSTRTSCELLSVEVDCRVVRFMSRAEVWMTFIPGTERSRSAYVCAGVVSRTCCETTLIVAGASMTFVSTLEALSTVTSSARRTASSSFAFSSGV